MTDVVSERILRQLRYGKYTRWAERLSTESLESLLWAVGVFGGEYSAARRTTGRSPNPTFAPHRMAEGRMRGALELLATVQAGGDSNKEPQAGSSVFDDPRPAFSGDFIERLSTADSFENWAAHLNECQLWTLLSQVGEYGVRVNSSRGPQGGEYPPPTFDVSRSRENLMRNALEVVAMVERGEAIDVRAAKRRILGDAV